MSRRRPLRAARAGHEPEIGFRQADLAFALARDADVAGERDLEAAAHGVTVERGDDELRRLLEAIERFVGVKAKVVLEGLVDLGKHLDVGTGAEETIAVAGQDDRRGRRCRIGRRGSPRRGPSSSRA